MRVGPPRRRTPRRPARESLRRGIYVLPSLFTVGNMLCGFAAVLYAIHDQLERAGWLIVLAGLLDGLDGRIARLTHSTSEFGKEYDSLADVVSFGVAPAILAYQWGLRGVGRWGWAVAFMFLVAGSVRLARFNVKAGVGDRRFFTGLPIPGGAGALTMMVLVALNFELAVPRALAVVASVFVFLVSILMVSTIPYRSFKEYSLRQRWPATAFFVIALIVAVIAFTPLPAMALLLSVYLVAGPAEYLVRHLRRPAVVPPPLQPAAKPAPPAHADHP
ncbi:MAG: CDP-diacylglycerol--serine O-phosphatidyltransferase [Thermoanaerobaculaceae bacterium]|nr:CDP-diacylglycerol--serine O-phosphatidyltransferase [Thermoanaerobaculaceae bacterium]TAM56115.1 MAG: CDP-diacylglycerol--serine O-phosphatidyltransferase [Acidobacteriota bacterium]